MGDIAPVTVNAVTITVPLVKTLTLTGAIYPVFVNVYINAGERMTIICAISTLFVNNVGFISLPFGPFIEVLSTLLLIHVTCPITNDFSSR